MFSRKTRHLYDIKISEHVTLESVKSVKMLGVKVDSRLSFSEHIAGLCIQAGRHNNALSRSSESFDLLTKVVLM